MWVRTKFSFVASVLLVCGSAATAIPPRYADVNDARLVNAAHVQLVINAALGL